MGHTGNGTCIRFVDESEFKVSVLGQRRLEKNRSPGFVLEPNCAEIIHYNIAGGKLKAVIEQANINHVQLRHEFRYFFIAVSTKSLQALKSTFY